MVLSIETNSSSVETNLSDVMGSVQLTKSVQLSLLVASKPPEATQLKPTKPRVVNLMKSALWMCKSESLVAA